MSEHLQTSSAQSVKTSGLSVDALARRQVLLGGLGKGSVVLAAATVPMHSLANGSSCQTDDKNKFQKHVWASPSRCGSVVGSQQAQAPIVQGYHRSCYSADKNFWPKDPKTGKSCADTPAKNVVQTSSTKTCFNYVKDNGSHSAFVVAYANAIKCGQNYSHTPQEIKSMAFGQYTGCTDVTKCRDFLSDCMETRYS